MNRYEIHLKDINRLLFGQVPPIFLIEVFIRTLIIYTLLLLIVRWLGKRMTGELTIMEMAVMVTLGAIVSTPMQAPDRGILIGLVLLLCAVGFQRGVSYLGFKNHWFENLTQGTPSLMVKDGVMQLKNMRNDRISRNQLLTALRQQGLFNLGMADRVYLEAGGGFSVYESVKQRPGLPTFPPDDDILSEQDQLELKTSDGIRVCQTCGNVPRQMQPVKCDNCGQDKFITAVQ